MSALSKFASMLGLGDDEASEELVSGRRAQSRALGARDYEAAVGATRLRQGEEAAGGAPVNLIAVDPGKNTGFAYFFDRRLLSAGTFRPAELLGAFDNADPALLVVIENPRWYPHDHKDVNDLLDLAVLVGEYKRHYESHGARVELVWPRNWKGNVPWIVANDRAVQALSATELALLPTRTKRAKRLYDHNMLDAIGLGLWKLGRLR